MPEPGAGGGGARTAGAPGPSGRRLAAVPTVQVDNDRVRVTEWRFAPGAATGWHRHDLDCVVIPLTTGRLEMRAADGETAAELVAGCAYYRGLGVEHDVINASAHEFVFVEVEIR
jgi:quercetin dioxygenase-like cupin family protein